jgi:hypothetical protein
MRYIALALLHLRDQISTLANMTQDAGRPFDEYQPQTLAVEAETAISVQPTYEVSERVESIIVTGPPAAAITLELGDRTWPLVIPATGIISMNGLAIQLGRSDVRQIIATVPGQYTIELMGHADSRGQLV